jgi:hypothetical protein
MKQTSTTQVASALCLALLLGCQPTNSDGDCVSDRAQAIDTDGDGINDCEERELGLDPASDDSDGDGFSDADEIACVSDPLDGDEVCYACGWAHNDPGTYVSSGNSIGDTADNSVLIDQCGEAVDLWDFSGKYYLFYLTAAW